MAEVQQQRLHELLVQQMTRAVPVAVRVSRNPLPEGHGALHVGRLVLNMSKYLIRLPNTSAKDHQRVRGRECKRGRLVVPTKTNQRTAPNGLTARRKAFAGQSCGRERFDSLTHSRCSRRPMATTHVCFGSTSAPPRSAPLAARLCQPDHATPA